MSREHDAPDGDHVVGCGQGEPVEQDEQVPSGGTGAVLDPQTRVIRDDTAAQHSRTPQEMETVLAILREKAATDNHIKRIEAESRCRRDEEADRAEQQRLAMDTAGTWAFILGCLVLVLGSGLLALVLASSRLLDVPYAKTGSVVGGGAFSTCLFMIPRWVKRLAVRFRPDPSGADAPAGPPADGAGPRNGVTGQGSG